MFEPNDKRRFTIIYPGEALKKETENKTYICLQEGVLKNNSNDKILLDVAQYQLTEACKPKHIIVYYYDIDWNLISQTFELKKDFSGDMYYFRVEYRILYYKEKAEIEQNIAT